LVQASSHPNTALVGYLILGSVKFSCPIFSPNFQKKISKNYFIFGNLFYFQKIGRKIVLGYFLNPKMCCPTALVQTMNDSFCCIVMSVGIKELVIKIFYSLNLQTEGSKSNLSLVLMSDQMFVVDSYTPMNSKLFS